MSFLGVEKNSDVEAEEDTVEGPLVAKLVNRYAECKPASLQVHFLKARFLAKHVEYLICITTACGTKWRFSRRYRQFSELHDQLKDRLINSNIHCPSRAILTPKKTIPFIEQRRQDLENYLSQLLEHFPNFPAELADFINLNFYRECNFEISVPEIAACSALKQCPKQDDQVKLGEVLEFLANLHKLTIVGSEDTLHSSNIGINLLPIDMSLFPKVTHLLLDTLDLSRLLGLRQLKDSLQSIIFQMTFGCVRDMLANSPDLDRLDALKVVSFIECPLSPDGLNSVRN
ncbi:hypothetical protein Ciccas_003285 [Cichlidogyrus casuarinus]|uniref:PX domain-containing protein n=1 Tax=Cichlidogyrus casuarinus TaxID=1844966 RepID=A0ABD2QES5_9PLAT